MTAVFHCPYCDAETLVEDTYLGKSGPCATCGRTVTVEAMQTPWRATQEQRRVSASARDVRLMLAILTLFVFGGGIVGWASIQMLLPELGRQSDQTRQIRCSTNLTRIGQALRAYHQVYGSFPPAVVYDDKGKPMHSWRVLILPYLGEQDLFNAYNMNETWDGPANSLLTGMMPDVYADVADPASVRAGDTAYLAIRGDGTCFPRQGTINQTDITDGLEQTVMVVESSESLVSWLEPRDLQVTRLNFRINSTPGNCLRCLHRDGPHILLADGTVRRLRGDASPSELRALTTIRGRDRVFWNAISR